MDIITCNLQIVKGQSHELAAYSRMLVRQALNSEISGGCWYFMDVWYMYSQQLY